MRRRSLEHHVFEEMSHPGLSISFMAGTNEHRQIDGDGRARHIREDQNLQTIVQLQLCDSLNCSNFLQRIRMCRTRLQVTSCQYDPDESKVRTTDKT